jgi:hypothetical protein
VYSQAPTELDSKLRWELFRLPELDCFDAMLKRLFRHELERVVMSYEVLRLVAAAAVLCTRNQSCWLRPLIRLKINESSDLLKRKNGFYYLQICYYS